MTAADVPHDLETLAAAKAGQILELISEPVWRPRFRPPHRRPRDPEQRKLLRRLHASILEVPRLSPSAVEARGRAVELLDWDPRSLSLDAVAELVDAWDQFLIENGSERFVRGLLATEHVRDMTRTGPTNWRDVFGAPMPDGAAKEIWRSVATGTPLGTHEQAARRMLAELYWTRATLYELDRTRMLMKAYYLWRLAPVVLLLIAGLAIVIGTIDDGAGAGTMFAAAVAGALGGAVSGTFKLRDQINRIGQLRAFQPAIVVQPLLGAAAGLFLLAVLESGLIEIDWGGPDWAEAAVFAFVGGFSEPFFLGVVSKVAELGEDDDPKPRAADGGTAEPQQPPAKPPSG